MMIDLLLMIFIILKGLSRVKTTCSVDDQESIEENGGSSIELEPMVSTNNNPAEYATNSSAGYAAIGDCK